jgi:thiol-disulfide isomerase/thioredoxin
MFRIVLLFCLVSFTSILSFGQEEGIQFFHGTWAQALEEAKSQKRVIFVDAYAVWCGPCKRMSSQVFPDKQVGDFFNKHFVNLKIDMEKSENVDFASKYPVGSYPTLMFIDETGKVVLKDVGAKGVDALLELGKKALGADNKSVDYTKKYEAGERSAQFIHDYVVELNKASKPSLKIVNDYLKTAKPEDAEITKKIIFEGTTEADSRVFNLMVGELSAYRKEYSNERVEAKIKQACDATLTKAISFKSQELLNEAIDKYQKHSKADDKDVYKTRAESNFYAAIKDVKTYIALAEKQEAPLQKKDNYPGLEKLALDAVRAFPSEVMALEFAEGVMKRLVKADMKPTYLISLCDVQAKKGDYKEAMKTAKKGKELAEKLKDPSLINKFDYFVKMIDEKS